MEREDWAARYERVRRQALEMGTAVSGWGLTLLMRRGTVAWIRAWAAIPSSRVKSPCPLAQDASPAMPTVIPPGLYGQIAAILANAFLETQQEVPA